MKFAAITICAFVLLTNLAVAWQVDSRCTGRRALEHELPFDPNEPDMSAIEDEQGGLAYDPTKVSSKATDIATTASVDTKNLRGSDAHRDLEALTVFKLKMYWEEGYCWQDEWIERRWCLQCKGSSCGEDDYLWLKTCSSSSRQKFVYEPVSGTGGGKLKPYTKQHLCWTRTRVNAHQLKECGNDYIDEDTGLDLQILIGFDYNDEFELHPNGFSEESDCEGCPKCFDNHHHPKSEEIIKADYCSTGRNNKTSKYEAIDKEIVSQSGTAQSAATSDRSSEQTSSSNGGPKLEDVNSDHCNNVKCGRCEGDCDKDDQCEGDLVCFQRGRYDAVPGCSGGEEKGSKSDFCVRPQDIPGHSGGGGGGGGGSKTVQPLGKEYCDDHECDLCQGDCDKHSQCKGNLVCYKRKPYESVPGCSGGSSDHTHTDYCIEP